MILTRIGNEVFFGDKKLTINAQASKGPNNEVVKIEGLEGSNGQKWVSLSRLAEGDNDITTSGREVSTKSKYSLTPAEAAEVKELQARIDAITEAAKARYVSKPKLDIDPTKMTEEERLAKIAEIQAYYGLKG